MGEATARVGLAAGTAKCSLDDNHRLNRAELFVAEAVDHQQFLRTAKAAVLFPVSHDPFCSHLADAWKLFQFLSRGVVDVDRPWRN